MAPRGLPSSANDARAREIGSLVNEGKKKNSNVAGPSTYNIIKNPIDFQLIVKLETFVNSLKKLNINKLSKLALRGEIYTVTNVVNLLNTVPNTRRIKHEIINFIINGETTVFIVKIIMENISEQGKQKILNSENNYKNILSIIATSIHNRLKTNINKTKSTFLTHVLKNRIKKYNKKNLNRVYQNSRKSTLNNSSTLKINFDEEETNQFLSWIIRDILHDSNSKTTYDQNKFLNLTQSIFEVLGITDKINISNKVNGGNPSKTSPYVRSKYYANKQVKDKNWVQILKNHNHFVLEIPKTVPHRQKNTLNIVKYKINSNKPYYKKFNIITNMNQNSTIKRFVNSLYIKKMNNPYKKIGTQLLCPARTLNAGAKLNPLNDLGYIISKIHEYNTINTTVINSKRLNVDLKLKLSSSNITTINLKIIFSPLNKEFKVLLNDKTITTTKKSNATNPESKIYKFLGDFMMILKVVTDSKKIKGNTVAFGTGDYHAAAIYMFLCKLKDVNVKPRLFFVRYVNNYNELTIFGMNDILSNSCGKSTKKNVLERQKTIKNKNNNSVNSGYRTNASNNNRNR